MIEYDRFIYLDVYRTGSTHIIAVLRRISTAKALHESRHASITKVRPIFYKPNKLVFASVRNPWDWYVSLWAYGAVGMSAIRRYLAANFEPAEVEELYDRSQPRHAFRKWLQLMHNPEVLNKVMSEHLPQSGLAGVFGLYTYRFMRVTTPYPRVFLRHWRVPTIDAAIRYHERNKTYRQLVRCERLDQDLIDLADRYGEAYGFSPQSGQIIRRMSKEPKNASGRPLQGYQAYYDEPCRELVGRRDRFFVDTFGYSF